MENQLQALVCPNCGASTTNHHRCDYCGSILVRFTAQNIAIDETKYGENAITIPGLKEKLKENIMLQKATNGEHDIRTSLINNDYDYDVEGRDISKDFFFYVGNRKSF